MSFDTRKKSFDTRILGFDTRILGFDTRILRFDTRIFGFDTRNFGRNTGLSYHYQDFLSNERIRFRFFNKKRVLQSKYFL